MPDIVIKPEEIVVDKNGKVTIKNEAFNKAVEKKLGKKRSDVEGQGAQDFFDHGCINRCSR